VTAVRKVELLVCGDLLRGDDGVGAAVVRGIAPDVAEMASVRAVGQLMPDDLLSQAGPVIVVDAVHGPPPGELVDVDLAEVQHVADSIVPSSCHALPLPMVIGIARHLAPGPLEGRFIGVAGREWEIGSDLSPETAAGVGAAAVLVETWIRQFAAGSVVA
jgi:hydrogenase maturation protease